MSTSGGDAASGDRAAPLGIIAGNGRLPILVAQAARRRGLAVKIVAHRGETLPEIDEVAEHEVTWVPVGALGKMARAFKDAGVTRAVMAGGLGKAKLLRDFRPDLAAVGILLRLRSKGDDALLRALADWFEKEGITIVDAAPLVPELYAPPGILTRRRPDAKESDDVDQGFRLAKALGALDVGQGVAVKGGVAVGVEAIEGTDELIRRAGRLAGKGVVVVKCSKPNQDLRFDVPTVGPLTIDAMSEVGATVLAVEAHKTLLLDRDEVVRRADKARICVLGRVE